MPRPNGFMSAMGKRDAPVFIPRPNGFMNAMGKRDAPVFIPRPNGFMNAMGKRDAPVFIPRPNGFMNAMGKRGEDADEAVFMPRPNSFMNAMRGKRLRSPLLSRINMEYGAYSTENTEELEKILLELLEEANGGMDKRAGDNAAFDLFLGNRG